VARTKRVWFWLVVIVAIGLILAFAFWLDPVVRNWLVGHPNRQLRIVMAQISRFGDWLEHIIFGLLLLLIAWWRGNKKWTRIFVAMLIACAIAGAATRVVKITAGRARPSVKTELGWNGPRLSEKYHAFPSGHVAISSAFFGVLCFASWRIGVPCLVIPFVIAVARMYVGAHYLSDVVFAAMLGLACAWLVARIMKVKSGAKQCEPPLGQNAGSARL